MKQLFFIVLLLAPLAVKSEEDRRTVEDTAVSRTQRLTTGEPFELDQVHLLEGPFKHAQEADREYLMKLDLDLMLYPFRREAKIPSPVKGSDELRFDFTGHYLGHYLSACAMMIQNTGDAELKKRADAAVAALAECQAKIGTGFVMGFPERTLLRVAGMDPQPTEKLPHVGVPWYCIHKVYAGLLDMYQITGNRQALDVLEKAAHWAGSILDRIDDGRMQAMLQTEHGGMNEVLADLYAVTGKEEYLKWSLRFNHRLVMDPFVKGDDPLDYIHANTQVPKFIGAARQAALTGDSNLQTMALGFWNSVTRDRSYVTGGNSEDEFFSPKAHLSEFIHGGTMETCNTYNMLKLTRLLFCQEPKAEYADFYERALLNHILASQNPQTGSMCYFELMESGNLKAGSWSEPNRTFSCCHASGLESHAKYADSIYFHDGLDTLYVNLYIASELAWKERGVSLRQETRYPDEGMTRLIFSCEKPIKLAVKLRRPWWATAIFQVKVNGQAQELSATPGSYATVKRTWKQGDTLEVVMPMTFHMEGFKDNPRRAAVMYGPVVMAGITQRENSYSAICADDDSFLKALRPQHDKPLEFTASPEIFRLSPLGPGIQPVTIKPLFRINDEPKIVYWDAFSANEIGRTADFVKSEAERQRSLQASTVDLVLCGISSGVIRQSGKFSLQGLLGQLDAATFSTKWFEQVEDRAHGMEYGPQEGSFGVRPVVNLNHVGLPCPMQFVPNTWLAYRMKVLPDQEQRLQVRLWRPKFDSQRPNIGRILEQPGKFEVLVDDQSLGTCDLSTLPAEQFVDKSFNIPLEITKGKEKVKVTFRAAEGSKDVRARVYECRILMALK
ncbi:MAG: beta-L-arabinofuranosidase domain-containing protein [Verrucomicrobiota bacterium]